MTKLEFPAYSAITHELVLRRPELFNTDGSEDKLQTHEMLDNSFRTSVQKQKGKLFDMTFNLYCREDAADAVDFFIEFNGDYLQYTDENSVVWVLQILDSEIQMDDISPNHWQFSLTGLRFLKT